MTGGRAGSEPNPSEPTPDHSVRPRRRPVFQGSGATLAGLLFAVLFVVGFFLLDQPPEPGSSAAEVTAYYQGSGGTALVVAGFYLVPFAGLSFLWFMAAARHRLRALAVREDALLDTVQITSGVLFVAMTYVAAAAAVAKVATVRVGGSSVPPDAVLWPLEQVGTMTTYAEALLMIYGFRTAAVFIMVSTTRALRAHLFPLWFAILSYLAVATLLFTLSYARALVLVLPAWVAGASIVILFRRAAGRLEVA